MSFSLQQEMYLDVALISLYFFIVTYVCNFNLIIVTRDLCEVDTPFSKSDIITRVLALPKKILELLTHFEKSSND